MLSATVTGMIITRYEAAFEAIPLLVSFLPMLMDTGGNCGSQSSTLVIRGLALEEIQMGDVLRVMWKEFRVSLVVGAFLAAANGARIWIMYHSPAIAAVIACSLAVTIVLAKFCCFALPILAKRLGMDPVSYTHLDVYKRQSLRPFPASSCSWCSSRCWCWVWIGRG